MPRTAVSPRRSSRARQQPSAAPSHSNSVSSSSSNRAERSTRSNNKQTSPQKSSTPQSLSSEDPSEETRAATSEPPQPRRSKRQHEIDDEDITKVEEAVEDEIIEDEETTRCVCGHQEYPGPPVDANAGRGAKGNHTTGDDHSDEAGGLFIQCDDCLVWQHGGCVSIMEQAAAPDNYYCEECKPDLHQLFKAGNGQKYSRYLPVWEKTHPKPHRKASVTKEGDVKIPKEKEKVARAIPEAFSKRRSTMNSRAAYDEDEVLRKVLEESKAEGTLSVTDNASRKGKRTRDDSEDVRSDFKRQRTASSPALSRSDAGSSAEETDNEAQAGKGSKKAPRGAAAKSQREKEMREREKERAEAASKRKGRADRRRADESDLPDDPPHKQSSKPSPTENEIPNTPNLTATMPSKRGGKRPGAGRGRSNQAPTPAEEKASPRDHEDGRETPTIIVNGHGYGTGKRGRQKQDHNESDKDGLNGISPSDPDNSKPTSDPSSTTKPEREKRDAKEPSMNELKRKAAAMLDYIEKAQSEMAKLSASNSGSPLGDGGGGGGVKTVNGTATTGTENGLNTDAETLQARLTGWQVEYGAA